MNAALGRKLRPLAAVPYRMVSGLTGVNIMGVGRNLSGIAPYVRDLVTYSRTAAPKNTFNARLTNLYPCLGDRFDSAGTASGDYFHQDLWAARKIFADAPAEHWDVGSRIDGFVAHLLSFRSVNVIDIRQLQSKIQGLTFHQGDVTALAMPDASIPSLSCLHAMEHVGLGRYGDPVDPSGCFKGMRELQRVLAAGGTLYFSVPIGRERVEFNAHRVFDPLTVIETFTSLKLTEFAAIDGSGDLVDPASPESFRSVRSACGLFVFKKPASAPSA